MGPLDNLKNVSSAIEDINNERTEDGDDMQLIASGGYNDIWLVNRATGNADNYVLRKPKEDALLPDQIRNEVACLKFVRKNLPDIPVPQVYDFNFDDCADNVYIAEEFIDGERLSDAWKTYDEPTKLVLAREIAEVIVKLGETTFEGIGGLMLEGTLGPTVEGMKLFKGRDKFHSSACYNIGPYASTKEYVLACYDKEIHYYTHAPATAIDWDLFEDVSRDDFVCQLRTERDATSQDATAFLPEEPFVLVHGDLHGRNVMVKDGRIKAILDWEFAGSYPLSELLGGMGVDIVEVEDKESEDENDVWSGKIVGLVEEVAREKGWTDEKIRLLVGHGNRDLQKVRVEMFP